MVLTSEGRTLTWDKRLATYLSPETGELVGTHVGTGRCCTCYNTGDAKVLLVQRAFRTHFLRPDSQGHLHGVSIDFGKHATRDASTWADTAALAHLPDMTQLWEFEDKSGERRGWPVTVWRATQYRKLTASFKAAWADYRALKKAVDAVKGTYGIRLAYADAYEILERAANMLPESPLADAIRSLAYAANNYFNLGVEVAPRNLMVGSDGQLILNDILFTREKIR